MKKYSSILFSMIVALSLENAFFRLCKLQGYDVVFFSYIVIILSVIPRFFLGNLIHYNNTHDYKLADIFHKKFGVKCKAMVSALFDFYVCLIEFGILTLITNNIGNFKKFVTFLLALSGLDVVWHIGIFRGQSSEDAQKASPTWVVINILTLCYCLLLLYSTTAKISDVWYLATSIVYVGAAIADFLLNIPFYLEISIKNSPTEGSINTSPTNVRMQGL